MDEIHLRRLLEENILRVEKENWEYICKEFQEERLNKPDKILRETQDLSSSVIVSQKKIKNVVMKQKIKPLKSNVKSSHGSKSINSTIKPNEEPKKQSTCCDGHFEMHHIHFLNHYQSQLRQQQWELHKKRPTNAIPLDLPCQRDAHFAVEKLQMPNKNQTNKENNRFYHFVHNEGTKKLTIQKLPSITVKDSKVNSNILLEEIREYDEDSGCKRKSFYDNSAKLSAPSFFNYKNASEPFLSERSPKQRVHKEERSMFTENISSSQTHIDRNMLKAVVKEILEDSESPSNNQLPLESNKENECSSKMKSYKSSGDESFGNRELKCSCHTYAKNTLHTQTEEAAICSTFCQTENASPDKIKMDRGSLRYLIQEVLSEYRISSYATPIVKSNHGELNNPADHQKEEKKVQADFPILEKTFDLCCSSKESQVSMLNENDCSQSNNQKFTLRCSGCKNNSRNKSVNESSSSNIEQQLAAVTSKVENLMNVINDHVKKKGELLTENVPQNNSSINERPIQTRDVSLQFSPYLINKSAYTSPVRTLEKANQCCASNQATKQYFNASTQAAEPIPESVIKKSATVATQSDYKPPVVLDTWMQTEEVITNVEAPEYSNNSSVSITPVSDSPFLDDVLSEGEIPLHLKFLYFHDHSAQPSSTEEKDFSLSEGEIHPRYLQSSYGSPATLDYFSKVTQQSSYTNLKLPTQHTEKWNVSVGEATFLQDQNSRQVNSSTPILDMPFSPYNYRNSVSSGEVPFHFYPSNKKTASHDNRQAEPTPQSVGEKDRNNFYPYLTAHQIPDKTVSPSNLSSLSSLDNSN